jgi:hypothetical protein
MILIDKIRTLEEIDKCLDISLELFSHYELDEIGIDEVYCRENLIALAKRGDFFRIVKYNDELVGWIAAKVSSPYLHSREKVLYQLYYHCSLSGYSAVKALILVHEAMIEAAREKDIRLVVTSSELDNHETFNRVLLKQGWIKRNRGLIYSID